MAHLPEVDRWAIVTHIREGHSYAWTATRVGCSVGTAWNTYQLYLDTNGVGAKKRKRKRPKLGGAVEQKVLDEMVGKTGKSSRKMVKKLRVEDGVQVTHKAILDLLKAHHLTPHKRRRATKLTTKQKAKRLTWCNHFKDKSVAWWRRVIFLDEKNFGATWRGNPKDDIVWGDATTPIPDRDLQSYQPSCKVAVAMCYDGRTAAVECPMWNKTSSH